MGTINTVPMANQLMAVFITTREVFEIREHPSKMYSWSAFLTAQLLVEIPWNMFVSSLFFLDWYWTVGFPNDRAPFTWLMLGIIFPLYYTSLGIAIASMASHTAIASQLFSLSFSFVSLL